MKSYAVKFVTCISFLTVVVSGEPPNTSPYGRLTLRPPRTESEDSKIVDQRLLDRVADIISADGDGSEDGEQEGEGYSIVDSDLFNRIARIISQNEGQTSPTAPAPQGPSISPEYGEYGIPPEVGSRLVGGGSFEIGKPQPARRIASFQLSDGNSLGGGYASSPITSNAYTSPGFRRGQGSRLMYLTAPRLSESIASFEIPESAPPSVKYGGY